VTIYSNGATVNATHWTANVQCTGCSAWAGYNLDPKANATFGWGASSNPVAAPTNSSSSIRFHDIGKAHFEVPLPNAKVAQKDWDAAITSFGTARKAS
jgi:cellobiose dehydrogenase (acceptor)